MNFEQSVGSLYNKDLDILEQELWPLMGSEHERMKHMETWCSRKRISGLMIEQQVQRTGQPGQLLQHGSAIHKDNPPRHRRRVQGVRNRDNWKMRQTGQLC